MHKRNFMIIGNKTVSW